VPTNIKEIVLANEENDSAPQSVVERRRQGTQSAFQSSNTSREDRQNDEADRRCSQAQSGNSRHWPRPRSVAFPSGRNLTSVSALRSRVWSTACSLKIFASGPRGNLALPSRGGRSLMVSPIATTPFRPEGKCLRTAHLRHTYPKVMPSYPNGPPTDSAPNRAQRSMLRPILGPDRRARAPAPSHPLSRSADRGGAS
jgi:hypothetical protein